MILSLPKHAYTAAGVDRQAALSFIQSITPLAESTYCRGVHGTLGGFAGIFDLKALLSEFQDPLLVSSTDGIGTKAYLAQTLEDYQGLGIDLVAMCVNDILSHGAEPLFFLDYYGTEKLEIPQAYSLLQGIALGCQEAGCALIGGETAQMPGLYKTGGFDLAGFVVGAVERQDLLPKSTCQAHDHLIGIASSGLHANGFSLVRHIVEHSGLSWEDPAPFAPHHSLRQSCLVPSRIYTKNVGLLLKHHKGIKALAHITGGGLIENIARVLPKTLTPHQITLETMPPIFEWLAHEGALSYDTMINTFNCGIGMIFVVAPETVSCLCEHGARLGENLIDFGPLHIHRRRNSKQKRGAPQGESAKFP